MVKRRVKINNSSYLRVLVVKNFSGHAWAGGPLSGGRTGPGPRRDDGRTAGRAEGPAPSPGPGGPQRLRDGRGRCPLRGLGPVGAQRRCAPTPLARAVVGHPLPVWDPEAVAFAGRLYAELASGLPPPPTSRVATAGANQSAGCRRRFGSMRVNGNWSLANWTICWQKESRCACWTRRPMTDYLLDTHHASRLLAGDDLITRPARSAQERPISNRRNGLPEVPGIFRTASLLTAG